MSEKHARCALLALRLTLGIVILIEAALFVAPGAGHEFSTTHMPSVVRLVLGWGEILGAVLLLLPRTIVIGGWTLVSVFLLGIAVHLLHGMPNVGSLLIYTAAAWTVAAVNKP